MLKGKVFDAKDAPVEGAKVTITAKGMKNSREVKTNKKGEFVQIGLFPGEYSITAEKDGDSGTVGTRVVGRREPRDQDSELEGPGRLRKPAPRPRRCKSRLTRAWH